MKDEFFKLLQAWKEYIKYCFYSKRLKALRGIVRRRLVLMMFLIFLGALGVFWFTDTLAYGQEDMVLGTARYASNLFPLTAASGVLAMILHFIRKNFVHCKRCLDFLAASFWLVLLSPLMLLIAILVKLDSPGPVFFRQQRVGRKGKIFNIWKFRTMRDNAESETGPVWASEDDPRITGLGRFLRSSHLDEIPQLINVFRGQMSIIGPRPERPEFVRLINGSIRNFDQRLEVRPGITGLAQVRYCYAASVKDAARKLKFDLLYIKRMCWALDLRIIIWTFGAVLAGEGVR